MELVYGFVREPPAPLYGHQKTVGQLFYLLKVHVEKEKLGEVCVSPIDVALVVDCVDGIIQRCVRRRLLSVMR